jgi:hypothetical protein
MEPIKVNSISEVYKMQGNPLVTLDAVVEKMQKEIGLLVVSDRNNNGKGSEKLNCYAFGGALVKIHVKPGDYLILTGIYHPFNRFLELTDCDDQNLPENYQTSTKASELPQ